MLQEVFQTVPKIFVAQSIRPDLLELLVSYVKNLMIEDHGLSRAAKELIAAYVSKINACACLSGRPQRHGTLSLLAH